MASKDLYNNLKVGLAISATLSGVTPGTALEIDTAGYYGCMLSVFTGTVTDAGTTAGITWELQESDTSGSGYTAVADTDLLGVETDLSILLDTEDDSYIGSIGYKGSKRYLKLIPTGSTGTDAAVTATYTLGFPVIAKVVRG